MCVLVCRYVYIYIFISEIDRGCSNALRLWLYASAHTPTKRGGGGGGGV